MYRLRIRRPSKIIHHRSIMRFHVYIGVLLLAASISAEFHPTIRELNIKSPSDRKRSNINISIYDHSRIINGFPAEEGQFPFTVLVRRSNGYESMGALISPSWVLSDAINNYSGNLTVYLGSVHRDSFLLLITTNDVRVHPNFSESPFGYNMALINLRHSVALSETINTIALPRQSQAYPNFGAGRIATIVGWGQTELNGPEYSERLHFGRVLIIPEEQCRYFFSSVCAVPFGETPQNGCNSNRGGPMILHDAMDDLDILVGLMNLVSLDGCISGSPSLWVRPQMFLDWIYNETALPIRP